MRGRLEGNVVDQLREYGAEVVEVAIELFAFDQAAALEVEQDHLAGTEASAANDGVGIDVGEADFGARDDEAGVGDDEAAGAKAVAIERSAQRAYRR